MARIRSVKPELRESDLVASWPWEVRYFWVLFWGYLDDYGRGLDIPKRIAGDCFPKDDIEASDINSWLNMMSRGLGDEPGPVCRYSHGGKRYVHAVNWHEHQKPNRPTPSRLPPCPVHEFRSSTGLSTDSSTGGVQNVGPTMRDDHGTSGKHSLIASLSEPLSESLMSETVTGAAEQWSSGAEEQQQPLRESRTEKATDGMRQIVIDAVESTVDEADAIIAKIESDRKPRNLGAFLRKLAADGDLPKLLRDVRADAKGLDRKAVLAAARASPPCEHGTAGGNLPHPDSGKPICGDCRHGRPSATASTNHERRSA